MFHTQQAYKEWLDKQREDPESPSLPKGASPASDPRSPGLESILEEGDSAAPPGGHHKPIQSIAGLSTMPGALSPANDS